MVAKTQKILSLFLVLSLIFNLFPPTIFAAQDVEVSLSQYPNVDIVLTTGETSVNTDTFEKDIKSRLTAIGIDPEVVNTVSISAVETSTVSSNSAGASEIFNSWKR